jgi:hypothetical protein
MATPASAIFDHGRKETGEGQTPNTKWNQESRVLRIKLEAVSETDAGSIKKSDNTP